MGSIITAPAAGAGQGAFVEIDTSSSFDRACCDSLHALISLSSARLQFGIQDRLSGSGSPEIIAVGAPSECYVSRPQAYCSALQHVRTHKMCLECPSLQHTATVHVTCKHLDRTRTEKRKP